MQACSRAILALCLLVCCLLLPGRQAVRVPDLQLSTAEIEPLGDQGVGELYDQNRDAVHAFAKSFLMIMVTELGDETFIIAAIMAMRHSRLVVYIAAMSALAFMTVISTALGYVLPNLISRSATQHAATVLYIFFGVRLLWVAWRSKPQDSNREEMEEVEAKLEANEAQQRVRWRRQLARICTPVFLEAFLLTFLAEWGDRSQIATITLAAEFNPIGVTLGAIAGHCLCTGTAVMGGQLLALRISQRTVAVCGGLLFLVFAVLNLLERHSGTPLP